MSLSMPARWLGVDLGNARVGIAKSDPEQTFAFPFTNIHVFSDYFEALDEVADIANDADSPCERVIIGLPLNMDGSMGKSAKKAVRFGKKLAKLLGADFEERFGSVRAENFSGDGEGSASRQIVGMMDERLTTVSAYGQLRESGIHASGSRGIIDQQSAVIILQSALDTMKRNESRGLV
jgi:putative Holliday junction resolvase